MSEIVNLRQARKARARRDAETLAAQRRAQFGRSKAERQAKDSGDDRLERHLDGHHLHPDRKADE